MSDQITAARAQQFNALVKFLLQQNGSRLRGKVSERGYTGVKQAVALEQLGPIAAQKKISRHADLPIVNTPHARRWIFFNRYEFRDFVDEGDRVQMLWDPKGDYASNFARALGRAMDDEVWAAFFGAAQTGETGTVPEAFDAANFQVAAGAAGMTVEKLRQAKQMFMAADVDLENDELYCGMSAKQHIDLLRDTQATSLDYTDRPVLVDGEIKQFMGFKFVTTQRVPLNGSGQFRCAAWTKSGVQLGIREDIRTPIDWLPEKQCYQVAGIGDFGATRTEQGRVVEIVCV